MSHLEDNELSAATGVMLRVAYPQILVELETHLEDSDRYIVQQLPNLLVVSQVISGAPANFSFMAYPVPRLSFEQRQTMDLQGARSVNVNLPGSHIRIDLDDFGKINWFYITNRPEMYVALRKFMPM